MNNNRKDSLISVIIPVYNVEKYLKRCLNSVVGQTYSHLEIILVNDGSTDQSGDICNDYADNDKRIHVLHKKNGGLSDARNVGLEIAKGEYIYFVDSDDFIAKDSIEFLYEALCINDVDIASHSHVYHYREDSVTKDHTPNSDQLIALTNEAALEHLLYEDHVTTSACMKLYKRNLFSTGIRFPIGKTCEDLATVYKLFSIANKAVLSSAPKYYYYKRAGSLTQSSTTNTSMDGFDAAKEQLKYIKKNHPSLIAAAQYRLFAEANYIAARLPLSRTSHTDSRKTLLQSIHQYKRSVLFDRRARASMRCRALMAFMGASVSVAVYQIASFALRNVKDTINK